MARGRLHSEMGNNHLIPTDELRDRIARDQRALREAREHWLVIEQGKYGLPHRARFIGDMPA